MFSISRSVGRVPVIGRIWQDFASRPAVRYMLDDLRLMAMYGRFRPQQLQLANSSNRIFVNPIEMRGRAILRCGGAGQPASRKFWRESVRQLDPTIVIDVGLNYGEFLFAETYRSDARLIGIEANADLQPWIQRSIQSHPNATQIEFYCALASDRDEANQDFYVDRAWSGRSSAIAHPDNQAFLRRQIRSLSVDSLFESEHVHNAAVLFKIDVEGFEMFVMRGMRRLLSSCRCSLGLIEFNTGFLRKQNIDADGFLRELIDRFTIGVLQLDGTALPVREPQTETLKLDACGEEFEVDLILASEQSLLPLVNTH